jgi:uncharacterized protein YkwD/outer membrane protein OmpA-like peptidoglycan-associated protein
MLRYIVIFLLSASFIDLSAQGSSPSINFNAINYSLIESEFIARFNKLRKEQNLNELTKDKILDKAATDQALYQRNLHVITHTQTAKGKEKVSNRIFFYNGTHDLAGENCIKIPLDREFTPGYNKKGLTVKTYAEAGEALFMGWKTSQGHYKNMIDPDYDVYGLGFGFDKDSSFLYCTQVFAAKQFVFGIEMQSPPNAYNVKEATPSSCSIFQSQQATNALKTFQLSFDEDSIFIRSEEAGLLIKFFNNPSDGIYFDLVQRGQFVCEKNNLLHGSKIHDGKMLPPVLFKDIFKRNRIKDGKNMYASVCKRPKQLKEGWVALNYGFIKNGYSCQYTYLVTVPENNLRMLDLYPKWIYLPNVEFKPDSFKGNISFTIPFERNKVELAPKKEEQLKQKLGIYKPFITSVDLQTFSSVEGTAQTNLKLQENRASNIMNIVKQYYNDSLSINTQATENWDEFFELIEYTDKAYLKTLPKDKIKEKLKSKALLDSLDFLLSINRIARMNIGLDAVIDNNSDPYLILAAYKKSIEVEDSLKSFHQQNKLLDCITKLQFESTDMLPVEIPLKRKFLPHLTNYLAVSIKDADVFFSQYIRNMAVQASQIDPNYLPVKFNLCIIALKYMNQFNDTILPPSELERNMNECFKLGTVEDSIIVNHMWLNYSILSVYTNWERHLYHNIDKHLLNIKKYYPGAQINESEAIELGLLFNMYARYQWTQELLHPYIKNKTKNEDLLFLFDQTYASNKSGLITEEEWEKLLKKARKMNPDRFYRWVNEQNFQLMRDPAIKKEFCEMKAAGQGE